MTDPTLAAILANILAHPDDDTPRFAFADRCDDLGLHDRAEFVRVQVERATLAAAQVGHPQSGPCPADCPRCREHRLTARELELLAAPHYDWLTPPPGFHGAWGVPFGHARYHAGWVGDTYPVDTIAVNFVRGFVGDLACAAADWLAHADAILQAHPVRRVTFTDETEGDPPAVLGTAGAVTTAMLAAKWPGVEFTLILPDYGPSPLRDATFAAARRLMDRDRRDRERAAAQAANPPG